MAVSVGAVIRGVLPTGSAARAEARGSSAFRSSGCIVVFSFAGAILDAVGRRVNASENVGRLCNVGGIG